MITIYLLEDEEIYRENMVEALKKTFPGINIYDSGNDIDFPRKIINDFQLHHDPNQILAIIDIELKFITYGAWCFNDNSVEEKQNAEFGEMEFPRASAHGFNIYNLVRRLSPSIKIALVSSYNKEQLITQRDNKPLPSGKNFLYIHRNDYAHKIIKKLKPFFKI